jgi:hypothetical protein
MEHSAFAGEFYAWQGSFDKFMKKNQTDAIVKASEPDKPKRTAKGPEPERLKINGVANWEDAVGIAMQKKKPAGGWPR